MTHSETEIRQLLNERILILDGAMGTEIQALKLDASDFHGQEFAGFDQDLAGNNDILNLTAPDLIRDIHISFLKAGTDIITTNTFNATSISQSDYGIESYVDRINQEGARLAKETCYDFTSRDGKPRWVAGAIGPTNKTTSISPDVNDPGFRGVNFDMMKDACKDAAKALLAGGVDLFLVETIFDTLNAKACIFALSELFEETGESRPIMISGTITDASGRTLTGQTPEAFWNSIRHANPFTVGLNCSFGARDMRPHLADLARIADTFICAYPNAGLPNAFGEYDEDAMVTATYMREWAESGLVNIVGGCCGTTPLHIEAIASALEGLPPRPIPTQPLAMRLSGLEPFTIPS